MSKLKKAVQPLLDIPVRGYLTLAYLAKLESPRFGMYIPKQMQYIASTLHLKVKRNPESPYTLKEYREHPERFVETSWLNEFAPKGVKFEAPLGVYDFIIQGRKATFLVHYTRVEVLPKVKPVKA